MPLFGFRRAKLDDDELRDRLLEAVAGADRRALERLTKENRERIVQLFPGWSIVPQSVRSDPTQVKFWAEGLIGVAQTVAALGDRSLLSHLERPDDNPMVTWHQALLTAQAELDRGNGSSAISILEPVLKEVEGIVGTGADKFLPRTYGMLGAAYYHAGDLGRARAFTLKARDLCNHIGDHEGLAIYSRNLEALDGVAGSTQSGAKAPGT